MRTHILLLLLALCPSLALAQKYQRPESYNYLRGIEAYNNNDYQEASRYLDQEIQANPDNGYAYLYRAFIHSIYDENGQALTAANASIKKISSKDKEFLAAAYASRAQILLCLEDTVRALKDYERAIDAAPDDLDLYESRAQIYFEQGNYELADADYTKMTEIDEGNVMGYMGLGRNAKTQERWDEAIKQFDYVIKLSPDYSSGYSFRAECYLKQKQYAKAADDVIKALSIDLEDKAYLHLVELADSAPALTIAKLKVQRVTEPNDPRWGVFLGNTYIVVGKYKEAIKVLKEEYEKISANWYLDRIAFCYDEIGLYETALSYVDRAASEQDSMDIDHYIFKAGLEDKLGRTAEAIATLDEYIAGNPDDGWAYYKRGWYKDHSGDTEGAIEDYTMSIAFNPDYAYHYLNRGTLYRLKGDTKAAEDDFRQVIEIEEAPYALSDSIPAGTDTDCAFYAHYYLGNKDKAISMVEELLQKDKDKPYYDAACLYSIMGENDKAVGYLRNALEDGYRNFNHIRRDRDLNNIRNDREFIELIKEYEDKQRLLMEEEVADSAVYEQKIEEIPFTKESGMCKVKCTVNGLPLHFIFDTGAYAVSISSVEATFMLKNGYLTTSDIIGRDYFSTATGEVSEGTVINLREVKFGNIHLDNVKASVVHNQSAPLLLGQTVFSKLGKIEIDNERKNLKVTYNIKK